MVRLEPEQYMRALLAAHGAEDAFDPADPPADDEAAADEQA